MKKLIAVLVVLIWVFYPTALVAAPAKTQAVVLDDCFVNPSDVPGAWRVCYHQLVVGETFSFPPVQVEGQWVRLTGTFQTIKAYSGEDLKDYLDGKFQTIYKKFYGAQAKIQYEVKAEPGSVLPASLQMAESLKLARANYPCEVREPRVTPLVEGKFWDMLSTGASGGSWPPEAGCAYIQDISINGVFVGTNLLILKPGIKDIWVRQRQIKETLQEHLATAAVTTASASSNPK